jgi:hypothetical protein
MFLFEAPPGIQVPEAHASIQASKKCDCREYDSKYEARVSQRQHSRRSLERGNRSLVWAQTYLPTNCWRVVHEEVPRASVRVVGVSCLGCCDSRSATLWVAISMMRKCFLVVSPAALPANVSWSAAGRSTASIAIAALAVHSTAASCGQNDT